MPLANRATKLPAVTDRALRYRANATPPPGPRRCAFCGNPKAKAEVGHVNGHEEDNSPVNLIWTCRPCNVKAGHRLKQAGISRLTRQYNPGTSGGAETMGQWVNAVTSIKGEAGGTMAVPDAVAMIRATSARKRTEFANDIWQARRMRGNPGETKFDRCLKAVKRKGVRSPGAVCQKSVGRGNKGKKHAKRNPAKVRRNPEQAAISAYRDFHGKDPDKVFTVDTPKHYHGKLAGIGKLESIGLVGGPVRSIEFGKGTYLTENEKRTQLFITGGDQSVSVKAFGIDTPHEIEVLGPVASVRYFTEKLHLIEKDGGKGPYVHKFKSPHPILVYDTRNKLLSFAGGGYTIPSEGIDG